MMVIAAGADECRLRAHSLHQWESEYAAIKIQRALEIRDFQVHVTDGNARVNRIVYFHLLPLIKSHNSTAKKITTMTSSTSIRCSLASEWTTLYSLSSCARRCSTLARHWSR